MKRVTGYAAIFYRPGDVGTEFSFGDGVFERIAPTAFDSALRRRDDCKGLINHNADRVLGRTKSGTLRLSVDRIGLRYELAPPDTETGRDAVALIERGDVTGASFSFVVRDVEWREEGDKLIREVLDVELIDVAVCLFPAYQGTTAEIGGESRTAKLSRSAILTRARLCEIEQVA